MTRQSNILSFDEARRSTSTQRTRASVAVPRRSEGASAVASRRPDPYTDAFSHSQRGVMPLNIVTTYGHRDVRAADSFPITQSVGARSSAVRTPAASRSSAVRTPAASRSSAVRASAASRYAGGFAYDNLPLEERSFDEPEDASARRMSRFQARKKARAKRKAEQKFTKQFGGADASSDAASAGPRAAVYKGEMGATHRRATRMQETAAQASAKRGFGGQKAHSLTSSPKLLASLIVVGCLVLSCLFLYPSAQQYYQSVRERDRLAAEYGALSQRNSDIAYDVEALQTDAGIENQARDQLGWVKEGEQKGSVQGLDSSSDDNLPDITANIASGSIEAPETWYSPFLDPIFGVE